MNPIAKSTSPNGLDRAADPSAINRAAVNKANAQKSTGPRTEAGKQRGMRPALLGLVSGLAAAFPLAQVLRSLLFEVAPSDPATFLGVSILFAFIALAACVIPARSATRLDPATALLSSR